MHLCNEVTRRQFVRTVAVGGAAISLLPATSWFDAQGGVFQSAKDPENLTDLERIHIPKVTLPPVVEDGTQASIIVAMDHPMEADHYIKSIQILNFSDPVVIKGQCFFTPLSGEAYIGTQIRLAGGEGQVWVVAECSQHGKWVVSKSVKVAAGGC